MGAGLGRLFVEETAQLAAAVFQLAQRLGLDLADTLAGDAELLADFLKLVIGVPDLIRLSCPKEIGLV
jgi:hypothetical protein